jgi:hypothetical protein
MWDDMPAAEVALGDQKSSKVCGALLELQQQTGGSAARVQVLWLLST